MKDSDTATRAVALHCIAMKVTRSLGWIWLFCLFWTNYCRPEATHIIFDVEEHVEILFCLNRSRSATTSGRKGKRCRNERNCGSPSCQTHQTLFSTFEFLFLEVSKQKSRSNNNQRQEEDGLREVKKRRLLFKFSTYSPCTRPRSPWKTVRGRQGSG